MSKRRENDESYEELRERARRARQDLKATIERVQVQQREWAQLLRRDAR
jgi:hypothetical protein